MGEFGCEGEASLWGFGMELQGRSSDLILEDVPHFPTSFLKTEGIALCPWNQESSVP